VILTPVEPATATGEEEAFVLSLACFGAGVTSAQVDAMSRDARERLRMNVGLSAEQFHVACKYIAAYQIEFREGLRAIREGDEPIVFEEAGAARLQ
jgi:hypothetical protein